MLVEHGQLNIDTARIYGHDTSEKVCLIQRAHGGVSEVVVTAQALSQLDLHGARVDTKIHPLSQGLHAPEKLKARFKLSLEALGPIKIRVFYLHAPDRTVPFGDTLEAVDDLYKEGHL